MTPKEVSRVAHDIEPVRTGVARVIESDGPGWEPQIITPVQGAQLQPWEWATQLRPPAMTGTLQEKWSKAVTPLRVPALFWLWITWHWARFAALLVVIALIMVLFFAK